MITKHTTVTFILITWCLLLLSPSTMLAESTSSSTGSDAPQQENNISIDELFNKANESIDPEAKASIVNEAIEQAKKQTNEKLLIDTYLQGGITLYEANDYETAQKYLESVLEFNNSNNQYSLQFASAYHHLGWLATHWKDYLTAVEIFNLAIEQYRHHHDESGIGNVLNSIGATYWYQRDYGQALEYFNQALETGQQQKDIVLQRKALTNKGIVFENLAQYSEALYCIEQALELNQIDQNKRDRAFLLNNLGNIQQSLRHYDAALNAYQEALHIFEDNDNKEGASLCYNNMGEAYLEKGMIKKAISNYQISLEFVESQNDSLGLAVAFLNIGRAHQMGKNHTEALSYCQKALGLSERFNDNSLESELYLHLGQNELILGNVSMAEQHLLKSIALSQQIGEKAKMAKGYSSMAQLYEKKNNYRQAYQYQSLYAQLKDSILIDNALENSARMAAVYNLLKKEETISRLKQEKRVQDRSLVKERSTKIAAVIISILMVALSLVLFLIFHMRRKSAAQLELKNEELKKLNATKDKFFSIIAHDLKSPFSSLMGFAEMLTLHAESKNTKEVVEYSQIIHNSTKRVLGLVENLLQWSRTQLGTTHYKPEYMDVSIQTQNIVSLLRLNAEEKDIVISPKVENELVAYADQNLFSTVLRNLISNAIKFSRVGCVIYVSAQRKQGMIEIAVADSGVGIRSEDMDKLFQIDSTFTTKGTFNEKGTGLGLVLCKEFVEINKGEIWVESELEKGSTFYFTIPLHSENQNDEK